MLNINLFIINLERCPEKRTRMIQKMEKYPEIKYEIFNAIDGQMLTEEYMKQNNYHTLDEWLDPFHKRKITKGEIGCSLSHYGVYEKAYSMDYEITLVLEDDAEFSDDFMDKLKKTITELDNVEWDMCYLGRKKIDKDKKEKRVGHLSPNLIYPSYSYWCIGYLINQNFCEKVINGNFLQNIIPIDEYLPIISDTSSLTEYREYYKNTSIELVSLNKTIINPGKNAFENSDTELSSYINNSNNKSKLLIITVATNENELLERFNHSCNNYGLRCKILGLEKQWTGGNMIDGPGGGMKLNLLKEELKNHLNDEIILFTDSYDVIFLSDEKEIMDKFLTFNCDLVFSGEKQCWPDKKTEHFFKDQEGPYKYINSGGFIGRVKLIYDLINIEYSDTYDDQYLIHERYNLFKNRIKIDTSCKIFQTNAINSNDIEILHNNNSIKNTIYNTYPSLYHGNGGRESKVLFNNHTNYLLKTWLPNYQYCGIKKHIDGYPDIYIFSFIPDNIYNIDKFLDNILSFEYPKEKIIIHVSCDFNINKTKFEGYKKFIISSNDKHESLIRDESIIKAKEEGCDYLCIDPIVYISDKNIITKLLSYDKDIICPMLKMGDKHWSNFWGDISDNGWYKQSFNYFELINYNHKGCWIVPYINNVYLIKNTCLEKIKDAYSNGYMENRGCDMAFCENIYSKYLIAHLCNEEKYGYLKDHNNISENVIDINIESIYDYFKDKKSFSEKYFDERFLELYDNKENVFDEPITDVLQFPFVNDIFCKEIIEICENYGKWSGATNEDGRIGHENVPSNDIHFTEIKLHSIWEDLIKTFIAPLISRHWGSFKTKDLNIGFIVKYEHDKFYKLGPHHDSSSYTINISLNDEYEGGEVNFIKKKKRIRNKKGYALIHPGRITHYHEGLPITGGTKYICVSFVN